MAACLYQENRVGLEPAGPVESVFVPSSESSAFGSRQYPKRRGVERPSVYDEATFSKQHLATESTIYFRSDAEVYPRAILWRILDDSQTLEIQSVDLHHEPQEATAAAITLSFRFESALISQGAAFASRKDPNSALVVHAITKKGEIITLTLRDEVFTRAKALEEGQGAAKWWKTHSPSALKIRQPYRIITWSADKTLYITLNDGGVVRLQQSETEGWTESIFSESTWTSSMRGLFKSQATARYGTFDMGAKAACSAVLSPTGSLLWTVCLDHTVRVWSTQSGKIVHSFDLAGYDRDLKQPVRQLLDPHSNNLVQALFDHTYRDRYLLVTYSPIARFFKIWKVEEVEEGGMMVTDDKPEFSFKPPVDDLIDTVGWQLVDFRLSTPRETRDHEWRFWILVRSGSHTHTFTIKLDLDQPPKKLDTVWRTQWARVHPGFQDLATAKLEFERRVEAEAQDTGEPVVERWMDWLLQPSRFSQGVLGTAVTLYTQSTTGLSKRIREEANSGKPSLRQLISSALNSTVATYAFEDERAFIDHEKQILTQIKVFNGILEDLQRHREKTLAMAFDTASQIPWHIMADQACPVRACCDLEIINHNHEQYLYQHTFTTDTLLFKSLTTAATSNVAVGLHALRLLHDSLPSALLESIREAIYTQALGTHYSDVTEDRMQSVYESTHLEGQISDECYDQMSVCFEKLGGWTAMNTSQFRAMLQLLGENEQGRPQDKRLTAYGARSLASSAQDTLEMEQHFLLDIVVLILFMSCELQQEDLSDELTPADIYATALDLVKERMIISWLAFTEFVPKAATNKQFLDKNVRRSGTGTIIEQLCREDWETMPTPKDAPIEILTYWARAWTYGTNLNADYEAKIPHIMSWLLKMCPVEVAGDFVRFMPTTSAWSRYVTARYYLMAGEHLDARRLFVSAAEDVSANFNVSQYDSNGLLSPVEKTHFGDGLPRYYLHLVSLFEQADAPAIVCDFASQAVQELEREQSSEAPLQREVTSRLFTASIQTSRYETAFEALTKQSDAALRRQFLHTFLTAVLSTSNIDLLLNLPWPKELATEADDHLADLCKRPQSVAPAASTGINLKATTASAEPASIPPHRLLYAWRIQRNDYRGVAASLWERIQMLKLVQAQGVRGKDVDAELEETYLSLINCLVLVEEKMRWLLVRPVELPNKRNRSAVLSLGKGQGDDPVKRGTRRIVTVDDIRREYQAHLDQVADFAAGRYPLLLGDGGADDESDDEMDVDVGMQDDVVMRGALQPPGLSRGAMEVDVFAA